MDEELVKKYNNVYLTIIMRYKEYIEGKENLYVAELPTLITPDDESVALLAKSMKGEDNGYSAVERAYNYISSSITTLTMPVQFWQKPRETTLNAAGDLFDKAVLLCTLLVSMGNVSSKVMIAIKNEKRNFLVYTEIEGRLIAIDIEKGLSEVASKEELMERLEIDDDISEGVNAYEFNDKMYVQLAP